MLSGLHTFVMAEKGEREAEADWTKLERPEHPQRPAVRRGQPLALLTIEDRKLYVLEGAGKLELRKGPGHLAGTALPGAPGNCIIAGHRDTSASSAKLNSATPSRSKATAATLRTASLTATL